jgi:AAHS family 4-hydroxybenzoate transporter-like MFS transporter
MNIELVPSPPFTLGLQDDGDVRRMGPAAVAVAVACGLAMFLDGYDMQVMPLIVPALAHEWGQAPAAFGVALAASVAGMVAGSAVLGPLGDLLGRKLMVVAALFALGTAMILTATAHHPMSLVAWRLLTGLGLGVCIPNCNAWTSDVTPRRLRSRVLVPMNAAIGLGAFGAGLSTPALIGATGWRGAFLIGGGGSMLLTAVMLVALPDSPFSLRAAGSRRTKLPGAEGAMGGLRGLLSARLRWRTLHIWALFVLNTFTLFLLMSWLPTLLTSLGWAAGAALRGAVAIQIGGVAGGLGLAVLLDRGMVRLATGGAWLLAGTCLLLLATTHDAVAAWTLLLVLTGAGL